MKKPRYLVEHLYTADPAVHVFNGKLYLYPSHDVLYRSLAAVLIGVYLLAVGVMANLVTRFGGTAAFPLKSFLVLVALVGLSVAGIPFLGIMGVFSAVAVAIEVALALTLLPAMLGFAGDRIRPKEARLAMAEGRPIEQHAKPDGWTRASRWWVRVITKVPVLTILAVIAMLGALWT